MTTTTQERTYTVPLRAGFRNSPKYYRTNRAVKTLIAFLVRHMKTPEEKIRIGQHLNRVLWINGIKNPPPRVTVTVKTRADGMVTAELAGKEYAESVRPKERTQKAESLQDRLKAAVGGKKGAADASADEPNTDAEEAPKPKKADVKAAPAQPNA